MPRRKGSKVPGKPHEASQPSGSSGVGVGTSTWQYYTITTASDSSDLSLDAVSKSSSPAGPPKLPWYRRLDYRLQDTLAAYPGLWRLGEAFAVLLALIGLWRGF